VSDWRRLLARIRPHRRTVAISGVLALLGAAGGLAQPLAAREVIEALADDESLLTPLLVLGGLVAFSAGSSRPTSGCSSAPRSGSCSASGASSPRACCACG
jgi:hypothetical protein